VRPEEVLAQRITHAGFGAVSCVNGTYVYPATHGARACSSIGLSNTDAPPNGARFWLDMSAAEIEALNVKRTWKTLLHGLADYGSFIGDTGGGGYGLIGFGSSEAYHSYGEQNPLVDVAKSEGWAPYGGSYVLRGWEVPDSVWDHLRVLDPCVSQGTC
jgi:hypothetical protein